MASSAALAGCGGHAAAPPPPRLAHGDAVQLETLARQVAHDAGANRCAAVTEIASLQAKTAALVDSGRVPVALRQPLLNGVARLAAEKPLCSPPAPAAVTSNDGGKAKPPGHDQHGHGHGHGHGEGGD